MNKVHEESTIHSQIFQEETWCLYHPKQIDRHRKTKRIL